MVEIMVIKGCTDASQQVAGVEGKVKRWRRNSTSKMKKTLMFCRHK
jgi:hypothetical protein